MACKLHQKAPFSEAEFKNVSAVALDGPALRSTQMLDVLV